MSKPIFSLFVCILLLGVFSCTFREAEPRSFGGEQQAVALADQMFEAIGGKTRWCEVRSLYIKALHTEPQMTIPYYSEIWRATDTFLLVIQQKNDSFHVKGVFNPLGGTIRYYDKRDTSRVLSADQLKGWDFQHNHNVYVVLHKLACHPDRFEARIMKNGRLAFYRDTTFVSSFGLDDQMRPHLFYRPNQDGSVSGSIFTEWGTDNGLVHSAGGHPLDSSFIYRSEIWQPSTGTLQEMFGEEIFSLE